MDKRYEAAVARVLRLIAAKEDRGLAIHIVAQESLSTNFPFNSSMLGSEMAKRSIVAKITKKIHQRLEKKKLALAAKEDWRTKWEREHDD